MVKPWLNLGQGGQNKSPEVHQRVGHRQMVLMDDLLPVQEEIQIDQSGAPVRFPDACFFPKAFYSVLPVFHPV